MDENKVMRDINPIKIKPIAFPTIQIPKPQQPPTAPIISGLKNDGSLRARLPDPQAKNPVIKIELKEAGAAEKIQVKPIAPRQPLPEPKILSISKIKSSSAIEIEPKKTHGAQMSVQSARMEV